MAVNTANTDAQASGNTIPFVEGNYTISGTFTFSTSPVVNNNLTFKSGTANTLTLSHAISADRTITLPDATTTMVGTDATQTLTNKTLTDPTITLNDNTNLTFGTGSDATIDYDGTDLVVAPAAVGTGDLVVSGASIEFDDSEGATFGTGKDATIQYDGTNLVINPQAVGSGEVSVSAGDLNIASGDLQIAGSTVIDSSENLTLAGSITLGGDAALSRGAANRLNVASGDDFAIAATQKLYLDSGGDTYITEESANQMAFFAGGTKIFRVRTNGVEALEGVFIGSNSNNNKIDDASNGTGSTTMYIGNQTITTSSDRRLKKNITDTQRDPIDIINALRVVDFEWDDPTDTSYNNRNARGRWTGLIAQEVVEVAPWVVNAPRRESDLSIDYESENLWILEYDKLVPTLVAAVQELTARVAALEAS